MVILAAVPFLCKVPSQAASASTAWKESLTARWLRRTQNTKPKMFLKFSLHDPVTSIRMNASQDSANYEDCILLSNVILGVIAVYTKPPDKISAEAELDANQVEARCKDWRKVKNKWGESNKIKGNEELGVTALFLETVWKEKRAIADISSLQTSQFPQHLYFLLSKSYITKCNYILNRTRKYLILLPLKAVTHNFGGPMKSYGEHWKC